MEILGGIRELPLTLEGRASPVHPKNLGWPLRPTDVLHDIVHPALAAYLKMVNDARGRAGDVLELGGYWSLRDVISASEIALSVERGRELGLKFVGDNRVLHWVEGGKRQVDAGEGRLAETLVGGRRFIALREAKTTMAWRGVGALLTRADIVAFAASPLLVQAARKSAQPVAYRDLQSRLTGLVGLDVWPQNIRASAAEFLETILGCVLISDEMRQRLYAGLLGSVEMALGRAWAQLEYLARVRLPSKVWMATAGNYHSRLMGLAVLEKGGEVRRFSHGGLSLLMMQNSDAFSAVELLSADTYVFPTEKMRRFAAERGLGTAKRRSVEFIAGIGDESFTIRRRQVRRARRSVIYAPTLLRGAHQFFVPDLPDVVHLDWQKRVAVALGKMPVDLLCKPHPAGVLGGSAHPIKDVAPVDYRPFEEALVEADVVVLDIMTTTTFWKAVATDSVVVLLNLTPSALHEEIQEIIERRCRLVSVSWSVANIPEFDEASLREAVLGGDNAEDPSEIGRYFSNCSEARGS